MMVVKIRGGEYPYCIMSHLNHFYLVLDGLLNIFNIKSLPVDSLRGSLTIINHSERNFIVHCYHKVFSPFTRIHRFHSGYASYFCFIERIFFDAIEHSLKA